jgi:hypothetical protein
MLKLPQGGAWLTTTDLSSEQMRRIRHDFLQTTIEYNWKRLRFWTRGVMELSRTKLLQAAGCKDSADASNSPLDICWLGCCPGKQQPSRAIAELLFEIWYLEWEWGAKAKYDKQVDRMRYIVQLSAAVMQSPQTTASDVKLILPGVNPNKFTKLCRFISRPVTNLRIMARVVDALPAFANANIIQVNPPRCVRLTPDHVLSIQAAWKDLEIAHPVPTALARRGRFFQQDCLAELSSHCEVQLIHHYYSNASLTPTMNYFGCSKKACFLCGSFVTLTPFKPRLRGYHGTCHPLWGVPNSNSIENKQILVKLFHLVREQILRRLEPQTSIGPVGRPQSTVVSDLKTAELLQLRRQIAFRLSLERETEEARERMRILYM